MYYFAYAFNLSRKQMQECCPGGKPVSAATLPNHKLIFTGWSRQWRGGTATIKPLYGEKVPGAVYEVSEREMGRLDKAEGYPGSSRKVNMTVYSEDGRPIKAIAYIKSGQWEENPPSREYLSVIQQGYRDWEIE